jgi:hypothetical protein
MEQAFTVPSRLVFGTDRGAAAWPAASQSHDAQPSWQLWPSGSGQACPTPQGGPVYQTAQDLGLCAITFMNLVATTAVNRCFSTFVTC